MHATGMARASRAINKLELGVETAQADGGSGGLHDAADHDASARTS
jgi:hypothetical protein